MSQEDPFGAPLNPPGFETSDGGFEPLASGDESVLASSGLTSSGPSAPRNKAALAALGAAVLVGIAGVAFASGLFRSDEKEPVAAVASESASPTPAVESETPSATPAAAESPKPKPPAPKPLAGKPYPLTRINSGSLGTDYTVTVPTGWTVARGLRNDRTANLDVRMRSTDKKTTLAILTVKPAVATGPLTPAKIAAVKAALLRSEASPKLLPGTPKGKVGGVAATGYDVTTVTAGVPVTLRTLLWQRGEVIYAAQWRTPTPTFAKTTARLNQLLAAVKFPAA